MGDGHLKIHHNSEVTLARLKKKPIGRQRNHIIAVPQTPHSYIRG